MDLKSRLIEASDAWSAAWAVAEGAEVPPTRLAKRVMDDGKFFDRLAESRKGPTTDTLEKFARYLGDPANWPNGEVAEAARAFAHVTGVSVGQGDPSPDTSADPIGTPDADDAGDDTRKPGSSVEVTSTPRGETEEPFHLRAPEAKVA